jgi:hypothetical protein
MPLERARFARPSPARTLGCTTRYGGQVIWWILGLGLLAAVVALWIRKKRGIPLLRARVSSLAGTVYSVQFEKLRPDVAPIEYVWLDLCWISKALFTLPPAMRSEKSQIVGALRSLKDLERLTQDDILRLLGGASDLRLSAVKEATGAKYSGTLYFMNSVARFLHTTLPAAVDPLELRKVAAAVVASSLEHIDSTAMPFLHAGLGRMRTIYSENPGLYDTVHSTLAVPSAAFQSARDDEAYLRLRALDVGRNGT